MLFITLAKFKGKPTKKSMKGSQKLFEQIAKGGSKIVNQYWTLGSYDSVVIIEGKDEKTAMKSLLQFADMASTETLIAVPREEAIKLLE